MVTTITVKFSLDLHFIIVTWKRWSIRAKYEKKFFLRRVTLYMWINLWHIMRFCFRIEGGFGFVVFNATFNNISVLSWQSVLFVEETAVPGENHQPVASHGQFLSRRSNDHDHKGPLKNRENKFIHQTVCT